MYRARTIWPVCSSRCVGAMRGPHEVGGLKRVEVMPSGRTRTFARTGPVACRDFLHQFAEDYEADVAIEKRRARRIDQLGGVGAAVAFVGAIPGFFQVEVAGRPE